MAENNFNDAISIGGNLEVFKKLHGPIDISSDLNRCTLNMRTCEKFVNRNMRNVCKRFTNSSLNLSDMLTKVVPPLKCPIEAGNYTVERTDVDLKMLSYAPLDGFIYNILIKLITTDPVTKSRIIASCIKVEVKIVRVRVKT
jgi:hypothetical protein